MPDSPTDSDREPLDLHRRVRTLEVSVARLEQIAVNTDRRLDQILVEMRETRADLRTHLSIMMGGFGLMLTAYLALLAAVGRVVHWW